MAYQKPQVLLFQEFTAAPVEVTEPLRAFLVGGNADLHRYADEDEKPDIELGEYDRTQDVCYSWPNRAAGGVVDQAYAKLFVDEALLKYYEDLMGTSIGTVISPVSGRSNWIESDSRVFKSNGTAYPRSAVFGDRDVKVGDVVYLRSVYDPDDTCEEIELWTTVKGFASVAIDSEIETARVDANNQDTVTATATIEQTAGEENCVSATVNGALYDGLADGDVEEEYTIEVVRSSVVGCNAARLRITSASGHDDADDVDPGDFGTPLAIGARGLKVTFTNTGGAECSSAASAGDVSPTSFVFGQTWVVNVRMAFEAVNVLAGGDYDGDKNDVYILECTRGGVWADLPQITVRTSKGLDASGPTEVTDSQLAIPIGTHGLTATFFGSGGGDADLSIGDDPVAGLRKGDKWYITVNAAAAGPVRRLILKDDLPAKMLTADDLDLRLFIKDNIEVSKNRLSDPPLTNFYTEATQICVQEGITAYHPSWTDDGVEEPLELWGGTMYAQYREWLPTKTAAIFSLQDVADIDTIPGPLHPDNPLKYAFSKALANSNGTSVYGIAVADPSDTDGWTAALAKAKGRRDIYNYVPLTFDKTLLDLFAAQANSESGSSRTNWKACFFALLGKTEVARVSAATSTDGEVVLATLKDNPQATGTQYTLLQVPEGNGNFITNLVAPGDPVRFLYSSDGFGNEDYVDFTVDEVVSENSLVVTTGHTAAVLEPEKVEIWHRLSTEEIKADLIDQAGAFSNFRVCAVWPDYIGNAGVDLPGYYLAAALAGYASGILPHQPLTNAPISGFDDASRSFKLFDEDQLDDLSEGGVWVVTEDVDGSIITRDATTTDNSDLKKRSESIRRNVDSISFVVVNRLKGFIGQATVNPKMLVRLRQELLAIIDFLTRSGDVETLGPQLISGTIRTLEIHPLFADRIRVVLDLVVPAPLNVIEVHLVV